jgi:hypothetical protein
MSLSSGCGRLEVHPQPPQLNASSACLARSDEQDSPNNEWLLFKPFSANDEPALYSMQYEAPCMHNELVYRVSECRSIGTTRAARMNGPHDTAEDRTNPNTSACFCFLHFFYALLAHF